MGPLESKLLSEAQSKIYSTILCYAGKCAASVTFM